MNFNFVRYNEKYYFNYIFEIEKKNLILLIYLIL